jgi:Phosphotransferase enzyme family
MYAYKSQLPPTVEPQFYEAARSPLLPEHRILEQFGTCQTMLVRWLDVPSLEKVHGHEERVAHAWRVLDQLGELDSNLPVYLDLGSAATWSEATQETFSKLRTIIADRRLPSVTLDEVEQLADWAAAEDVLMRIEQHPRIAHADLRADQIFIDSDEYRIVDWQRPVLGPAGLDTVSLLKNLGVDPRPYVSPEVCAVSHFILLHWAVVAQHDLFPKAPNDLFDLWARTSISSILH